MCGCGKRPHWREARGWLRPAYSPQTPLCVGFRGRFAQDSTVQQYRERVVINYVYMIYGGGYLKIGVAQNPDKRLKTMQTGNPYKLRIMALIPFQSRREAFDYENELHKKFKAFHYTGEWFHYGQIKTLFATYLKSVNKKYNGVFAKKETEIPRQIFDEINFKQEHKKRKTRRDQAVLDSHKALKKFTKELKHQK